MFRADGPTRARPAPVPVVDQTRNRGRSEPTFADALGQAAAEYHAVSIPRRDHQVDFAARPDAAAPPADAPRAGEAPAHPEHRPEREPADAISADRRRQIDAWVKTQATNNTWNPFADDAHDKVAGALRGESDLGGLNDDEKRHLVDRALTKWITVGEGYDSAAPSELAGDVKGNRHLAAIVAERCAEKAADIVAKNRQRVRGRMQPAETLANAGLIAIGKELGSEASNSYKAAVRELVRAMSPEDAANFAQAVAGKDQNNVLTALNEGPMSRSVAAYTFGAFATTEEHNYNPSGEHPKGELVEPMSRAMARATYPDDPEKQRDIEERLRGLLATDGGRKLLVPPAPAFDDNIGAERRGQALALVLAKPGITAEQLGQNGTDFWANALIAEPLAREPAMLALLSGEGESERLSGAKLDNSVGLAMHFLPDGASAHTPPESLQALREAALRGDRSYYTKGDNAEAVGKVTKAIREIGGDNPEVAALPIQYSSNATGPIELPLFKVKGKDGRSWFVDNEGARYESFGTWERKNCLPPGNVTYPSGGELRTDAGGRVVLKTGNTPRTIDTGGEQVAEVVDAVALIGGLALTGVVMMGSGGTAAPVLLGAATGWETWRAAGTLNERDERGLSNTDFGDPEVSGAWLTLGLAGLGATTSVARAVGLARAAYAARTAARGEAVDSAAKAPATPPTLPGLGGPLRSPDPNFPPNQSVAEAMKSSAMQQWVKNDEYIDCSEIADGLKAAANGRGEIIEVRPTRRLNLNVFENGKMASSQAYHQVFTDGKYVYDPRLAAEPIPRGDWERHIRSINPDGVAISNEPRGFP